MTKPKKTDPEMQDFIGFAPVEITNNTPLANAAAVRT